MGQQQQQLLQARALLERLQHVSHLRAYYLLDTAIMASLTSLSFVMVELIDAGDAAIEAQVRSQIQPSVSRRLLAWMRGQ